MANPLAIKSGAILRSLPALALLVLVGLVCWVRCARTGLDAALLDAAIAGRTREAEVLLGKGANSNARGVYPTCGTEPPVWSMNYCRYRLGRLFGEHRREDEKPVLVLAVEHKNTPLVEALLTRGADINMPDGQGRTPLMWAARSGQARMVRLLLRKGAHVNRKDAHGWSARLRAEASGDDETEAVLKQAGAER